jgi:hypothetical protein
VLGTPLLLTLAGAVSACANTEPRELGFTQSTQDLANVPDEPFFEEANEFVGRWVGTAQETLALTADGSIPAYRFPSGSSSIAVDVTLQNGQLIGNVTFGAGAALPAATDPDVGYPAGVAYDDLLSYELNTVFEGTPLNTLIRTHFTLPPFEGFAYALTNVNGTSINDGPLLLPDGVVSLGFSSFEPLQGWCQLQTPYEGSSAPGHFSCIPDHGGGVETLGDGSGGLCDLYGPPLADGCLPDLSNIDECLQGGEAVEQVNCDKVTMCSNNFCACDSETCWAAESSDRLTLRRVGDELVGLLENTNFKNARGLNTPLGEVRLQRAE